MARWPLIVGTVAVLIVGSCVGVVGLAWWYALDRQESFRAHTRELQALVDQRTPAHMVEVKKGPPVLRSDRGERSLSMGGIPGAEQLPSAQAAEVRERLARWPTTWVYRHDDALEILFFDDAGTLVAFNRCLP